MKDEYGDFGDVVNILKAELEKADPGNEIFRYRSSDFEST